MFVEVGLVGINVNVGNNVLVGTVVNVLRAVFVGLGVNVEICI